MSDMGDFCPRPEALAGWLEQTLSAPERAKLTSHLASCDECRRAVTISSALEPKAGGTVDEVLLERLVQGSRRRPAMPWMVGAAAGVLVAGLAFWAFRPAAEDLRVAAESPSPTGIRMAPGPFADPQPKGSVEHPLAERPAPLPDPSPAPAKRPEPVPVETPKVEEPRKPLPPEDAKPAPVVAKEEPAPLPPPRRTPPGMTEADLSRKFASLYVVDPSGDLWIQRDGAEPLRVGRSDLVGYRDTISARDSAGAFALEGKATLALEKGASATVAWQRLDQAYSLDLLSQAGVLVDTEGAPQKWQVSRGSSDVTFVNLNGRFVVEPKGDQLSAVLLAGRCDLKIGTESRAVESSKGARELMIATDGKVSEKAADPKKYARLAELRPAFFTVFSATFDKDEIRVFPYTVQAGKVMTEGSRTFLHADVPTNAYPKSGEKVIASCAVKPERPILASDRIVLSFWYRSNLPTFTIKLGKYSAVYTSRLKSGEWGEGRIQISAFDFEGTPPSVPEELPDIQFQTVLPGNKVAVLDIDGVSFLRRAK